MGTAAGTAWGDGPFEGMLPRGVPPENCGCRWRPFDV